MDTDPASFVISLLRLLGSLVALGFWAFVSCLVVGPRCTWRAFRRPRKEMSPASPVSETFRRSRLRLYRVDRSHQN